MTGTFTDSSIGHQRSADIALDTDGESDLQRLVRRRAQQLKEDRESLNKRLERYIQRRSIEKWTPTHPSYNRFNARLKSFDTWTQVGSAITQLTGRSGLLFSRYIVAQNTFFSN